LLAKKEIVEGIGSFQKRSTPPPPPWRKYLPSERGGKQKWFLIFSKCIRTSEGGRGVNFQFPDVFWNEPFKEQIIYNFKQT
jgi:hypothetical protein